MVSLLLSYTFNAFLKTLFCSIKNIFLCVCFLYIVLYVFLFVISFSSNKMNSFSSPIFLSSHPLLLLLYQCLFFHLVNQLINHAMYQIFFKKSKFLMIGSPVLKNKLLWWIILSSVAAFLRIFYGSLVKFISKFINMSFRLSSNNIIFLDFSPFSMYLLDFFLTHDFL